MQKLLSIGLIGLMVGCVHTGELTGPAGVYNRTSSELSTEEINLRTAMNASYLCERPEPASSICEYNLDYSETLWLLSARL